VLVPPGDPAALAGALAALLQDPDGAAARAARARTTAQARYAVDAMVAGYLGVYQARAPA
jgi:glycosyltransferase involved in cell wall biosynthesis